MVTHISNIFSHLAAWELINELNTSTISGDSVEVAFATTSAGAHKEVFVSSATGDIRASMYYYDPTTSLRMWDVFTQVRPWLGRIISRRVHIWRSNCSIFKGFMVTKTNGGENPSQIVPT